ncbi:MAG: radical SAM protein [Candidatus Margulisbacteria bacterium]|jgi:wyosine [tRNA(Phe)-imidazoG37] synthetase (radical SAM superfamily)|nr:radical SAM protein [Candidatus Margulisiibacteriota bacterium]
MPRQGNETSCLFGPVNSRRLGHSLGIDLVKFKTCTFNCVFCECGRTTALTTERQIFIPTAKVLRELGLFFAKPHCDSLRPSSTLFASVSAGYSAQRPPRRDHHAETSSPGPVDVLTFSGGGEPTLAANLGEVIAEIKKNYPAYKVCLLTNSTLLSDSQVRAEIKLADIIIPSLNAVSPPAFQKINRPPVSVTPEKVLSGLLDLRREYTGQLLLEIFIVPEVNDTPQELALLREAAALIKPDGVQLNSLDRAGAEDWVKPASAENMQKIKEFFKNFNTNYYLQR